MEGVDDDYGSFLNFFVQTGIHISLTGSLSNSVLTVLAIVVSLRILFIRDYLHDDMDDLHVYASSLIAY